MRTRPGFLLAVCVALLLAPAPVFAQNPSGKGSPKPPKPPPDEVEEMVKEIKKAYEPVGERHNDIIKELRKAYLSQSSAQEEKILKDIRKVFLPTPEQEEAIVREIRKAYGNPSAAQEERIIQEISKAKAIPLGGLIPDSVASRADGMFRKLDQDADGLISFDEMPESLRKERDKWDANRDGFVDSTEYRGYFMARTQRVHEEMGAPPEQRGSSGGGGGGNGGGSKPAPLPVEDEDEPRPVVYRAGNLPKELPAWFAQIDIDGDGQITLYEWRTASRALTDFDRIDRNGDGFLTIAEVLYQISGRNNLNGVPVVTSTDTRTAGDGRSLAPSGPGNPATPSGSGGRYAGWMPGGRSGGPGSGPPPKPPGR